jgi:hypothetical protein
MSQYTRADAIKEFTKKWPEAAFGPCHWILGDFNDSYDDIWQGIDIVRQELARGKPEENSVVWETIRQFEDLPAAQVAALAQWIMMTQETLDLLVHMLVLPRGESNETN